MLSHVYLGVVACAFAFYTKAPAQPRQRSSE